MTPDHLASPELGHLLTAGGITFCAVGIRHFIKSAWHHDYGDMRFKWRYVFEKYRPALPMPRYVADPDIDPGRQLEEPMDGVDSEILRRDRDRDRDRMQRSKPYDWAWEGSCANPWKEN